MCPDPEIPLHQRPILEEVNVVGELIVLRPIRPDDAKAAFLAVDGREEILRWSPWRGPENEEELRERFALWRKDDELSSDYQFAICEVTSNRLVGTITLNFAGHPEQGDLGYWINVEDWGRGFATEAIQLVDYLAFQNGLARVIFAKVFVGNDASRKVLEKNGYSLEHTTKSKIERLGEEVPHWYLLQTSAEWIQREAGWRPQTEKVRLLKFDRQNG